MDDQTFRTYIRIQTDSEAEAVKKLEKDIEAVADNTPSWLWDVCGLSYVYEAVDLALLDYERSR